MTLTQLESLAPTRLAVGLLQGVVLYLLYRASDAHIWPATEGIIFSAILMVAIFVPTTVVAGLGNLRGLSLAIWALAATVLCAALGFYDIFRSPFAYPGTFARIVPEPPLWLALAAILFISHSMTVAGDGDHRLIASYPRYIEVAWKHGVQAALAAFFVGAFWALLWLGAELFELIGLKFLTDLIKRPWFWIPVTAIAVTYAIHVTDVRVGLVSGARTLKLIMLSWLLPLFLPMMTGFAIIFVVALPFTGLAPLWSTRQATLVLLMSVSALVFLINASYQEGQADAPVTPLIGVTRLIAAIIISPLVALAAYGLMLRVQQYGWTPRRIFSLSLVFIAACYAIGYLVAAARSRLVLKELEVANTVTACLIVLVLVALFSPVADPAAISVASQVERLKSGKASPEKFDYVFLRAYAGRGGIAALERLAETTQGPDATVIAERARAALASANLGELHVAAHRATPERRAFNITVIHPSGQALPDSFLRQDWPPFEHSIQLPRCLSMDTKCDAVLVDLDQDGRTEILLFGSRYQIAAAFKEDETGQWRVLGAVTNTGCPGVAMMLGLGQFQTVAPRLKDIEVGGNRLQVRIPCK